MNGIIQLLFDRSLKKPKNFYYKDCKKVPC